MGSNMVDVMTSGQTLWRLNDMPNQILDVWILRFNGQDQIVRSENNSCSSIMVISIDENKNSYTRNHRFKSHRSSREKKRGAYTWGWSPGVSVRKSGTELKLKQTKKGWMHKPDAVLKLSGILWYKYSTQYQPDLIKGRRVLKTKGGLLLLTLHSKTTGQHWWEKLTSSKMIIINCSEELDLIISTLRKKRKCSHSVILNLLYISTFMLYSDLLELLFIGHLQMSVVFANCQEILFNLSIFQSMIDIIRKYFLLNVFF